METHMDMDTQNRRYTHEHADTHMDTDTENTYTHMDTQTHT